MPNDMPYMQFFPNDWLNDTERLPLVARSIWIDAICKMHIWRTGTITGTLDDLAQWFRAPTVEILIDALVSLIGSGVASSDLPDDEIEMRHEAQKRRKKGAFVTVECRRLRRFWNFRNSHNIRQKRYLDGKRGAKRGAVVAPQSQSQSHIQSEFAGANSPPDAGASAPPGGADLAELDLFANAPDFDPVDTKTLPADAPGSGIPGAGETIGFKLTNDTPPASKSRQKGRKREKPPVEKFDPFHPTFPAVLDTEPFRRQWDSWISYRRERRLTVTQRCLEAQLAKLEQWGHDDALASIGQSICNGWQGLFEPQRNGSASGGGSDRLVSRVRAPAGKYERFDREARSMFKPAADSA